ncbi:nuclear transport factor 2 family protein [Leptolyngbya sp. FACHB-261]|uniref:nuclear transport factor 2 family protein n=1 Tax=Leptolyngbya sp. FACHB-261 TaxID=2692806 RepID=UPI001682AF68|nr:nuclear transport factor 2 family protein [Leptolyngbya sp. FACHB-261]MBD2100011.1 nuclear transport factor 2 family protein [Leptolyngbya sp. FACHB-261]
MNTKTIPIQNASSVLLKMEAAINAHDIDTFVNCFAPDFVGEQPVYPERNLLRI